jgi:hypothetical protein
LEQATIAIAYGVLPQPLRAGDFAWLREKGATLCKVARDGRLIQLITRSLEKQSVDPTLLRYVGMSYQSLSTSR